jgi:hypothetical protein
MSDSTEKMLASVFNNIFYEKKPVQTQGKTLEQSLALTYLWDSSFLYNLGEYDLPTSAFLSFPLSYDNSSHNNIHFFCHVKSPIQGPFFEQDINVEPLVVRVLDYLKHRDISKKNNSFRKHRLQKDMLREMEPNNAAIMAGAMYARMFRNKNLLPYAKTASDERDLKALAFIDYLFRSVRKPWVSQIMETADCLESKALQVKDHLLTEYSSYFDIRCIDPSRTLMYMESEEYKDIQEIHMVALPQGHTSQFLPVYRTVKRGS